MARRLTILAAMAAAGWLICGPAAFAQDATTPPAISPPMHGLWLTTPYPETTARVGDDIRLNLSLTNKAMPPQRVELAVNGLPDGWTYEIDGGGKPVTAAIVPPDGSQSLQLKLTPPKGAKTGSYPFTVTGKTDAAPLTLPVTLALAAAKPATVSVQPKLPALRGTPTSAFDFDVDVKNEGADDQTYNLVAQGPPGFVITFKEQYGSQELTSIPVKAGATNSLKVSVKLPQDVAAGQYTVGIQAASKEAHAETPLLLDVTGQPSLTLDGPEGRLSGDATAGKQRTFKFTVHNGGSAPATQVNVSANVPSGWKAEADPKAIPSIAPGQDVPVNINLTPSDRAIAGDYVMTVRAAGEGASNSASFRVTVLTSTMWGIAGLGVIGAAVLVLAVAVTRYGRR